MRNFHACRLLITFANYLDPDQARQNVRLDLDPNTLIIFLKKISKKFNLKENKLADDKNACKIIQHAELRLQIQFYLAMTAGT